MNTRVLPHHDEAEASILGGVILRNDVLVQLDALESDDFYEARNRIVFGAIRNLEATSRPIDVVTLEAEIENAGKLDAIGGVAFLGELCLRVPTVDNVVAYAEIVRNKSVARKLMLAASDILERGYQDSGDADEYLSSAMAAIARLDRAKSDRTLLVGDVVKRRVREYEELAAAKQRGEKGLVGVPTGIAELDKFLGGYPLGDVTLLAARPAMGKTSMAMSGVDAATAAGFGAHVFSQEGGWRMQADKIVARFSGISVQRLRAGDVQASDTAAIGNALMKAHMRKNWMIDDRAGLSAQEIIRSVRRYKAEIKTKLVVVDYIQVIRRSRGLDENAALDEIITAFSHAALADDIAYLVLCQLNRKVEDRVDKRPQKQDLRGSGALEERPRVIVSPYRGAYYYDEPKKGIDYECSCLEGAPCNHAPSTEEFERLVKVLVIKNNNGAEGFVDATWSAPTTEMW